MSANDVYLLLIVVQLGGLIFCLCGIGYELRKIRDVIATMKGEEP